MQFRHFYEHGAKGGTTFCVEAPSKQVITGISFTNRKLKIKVGIAKCSIKDQYSRSTGRSVSISRLVEHDFELKALEFIDDKKIAVLFSNEDKTRQLLFTIHSESDKVRFVEVDWRE
jgi:hypothetical protein